MGLSVCTDLQYHNIIITEGAELRGPGSITPDHFIDEILEIKGQLLHTHTLQEENRDVKQKLHFKKGKNANYN